MKTGVTVNGTALDAARRSRYWSWNHLADKSHVAVSTLFSVKNGQRRASFSTLTKIAEALDLDPADLVQQTP